MGTTLLMQLQFESFYVLRSLYAFYYLKYSISNVQCCAFLCALCRRDRARMCIIIFLVPDSVGTYSGYSAAAITEDNRLGKCCFFAL